MYTVHRYTASEHLGAGGDLTETVGRDGWGPHGAGGPEGRPVRYARGGWAWQSLPASATSSNALRTVVLESSGMASYDADSQYLPGPGEEVEGMQKGLGERLAVAGKALANLGIQREELNKEIIMLKTSLLDRSQVEYDLRAQLASAKDAAADQPRVSAASAAADAAKLSAAHAEVARITAELSASHEERRAEAGPFIRVPWSPGRRMRRVCTGTLVHLMGILVHWYQGLTLVPNSAQLELFRPPYKPTLAHERVLKLLAQVEL